MKQWSNSDPRSTIINKTTTGTTVVETASPPGYQKPEQEKLLQLATKIEEQDVNGLSQQPFFIVDLEMTCN